MKRQRERYIPLGVETKTPQKKITLSCRVQAAMTTCFSHRKRTPLLTKKPPHGCVGVPLPPDKRCYGEET